MAVPEVLQVHSGQLHDVGRDDAGSLRDMLFRNSS